MMKKHHARAAKEIFGHHNPEYEVQPRVEGGPAQRCDLHGLFVGEAKAVARKHLCRCKDAGIHEAVFITGWGKGSKDGEPKVKPAILALLKDKARVDDANKGRIMVQV